MNRKALAFIVTVCMLLTMIPVTGFAETAEQKVNLADPAHWAAEQIEKWSGAGLIKGDERGFRPDDPITRAEMAVILNNLMGYQVKAANVFADVSDSAWYADAVLKANAAGVLSGDGKGHAFPEKNITREEAAAMFARALSVDANTGSQTSFKDAGDISSWAKPFVFGMEAYKYIGGKGNGIFAPKAAITRAEVVTIVNNAVRAYYTEAGTYTGNVEPLIRGAGCVAIVKAADVIIRDAVISGDLIVAEGVGDGDFTLDNTEINGRMIARGGGADSIIITGGSNVQNLRIERIDGQVRVFADDGTEVGTVIADGKDDIIIEGAVSTVTVLAENITVTANNANIGTATITGANSNVILGGNSSVGTMTVNGANTTVTAAQGSQISNITVNGSGTSISGTGQVGNVNANANNVSITTPNTTVKAGEGTQGVTAGNKNVDPGTSQNTSGPKTGRSSSNNTPDKVYQFINGDFETGDFTGWTVVSDGINPSIFLTDNDFISNCAQMGNETVTTDSAVSVSQRITVKSNEGTPFLVFSYLITGTPQEGVNGIEIYINDSPEPIEYLWENAWDWTLHSVDLSGYKGQTIDVTFYSYISERADEANFGIDNISIQYEPDTGNTSGNAISISTDAISQTHWILPEDDEDWFKFNAEAGEILKITTSDLYQPFFYNDNIIPMDTYMYLYDTDGASLLADNDDFTEDNLGSGIAYNFAASGTYYIKVVHYDRSEDDPDSSSIGRYDIVIDEDNGLLDNGDFETGDFSGWDVKSAGVFPVVQDDVANGSSRYSAHMGDGEEGMSDGDASFTSISQYLLIEDNGKVPTLYLSYYVDDQDEDVIYDGVDINIIGQSSQKTTRIESIKTDGWQQLSIDLREFTGELVLLSIIGWTVDDIYEVNYYIDDIVLTYDDRGSGEPGNNTTAGAVELTAGTPLRHWIDPYDDIDYFSFEADAGALYTVETLNLYPDIPVPPNEFTPEDFEEYHHMVTGLFIVDEGGAEITEASDECYSEYNYKFNGINKSVVNYVFDESGTYYVKVINPFGSYSDIEEAVGRYDILLTENADAGDDYTSAALLTVNDGFKTFTIDSDSDTDWYKFEASAGMTYRIGTEISDNSTNDNSDMKLTLYGSDGISELAGSAIRESGDYDFNELKYTIEESGTYYLEAVPEDYSHRLLYNIAVYEDPAGDGTDISDVLPITVNGEPQTHYINPYFDVDAFTFDANAGKEYIIKAHNLSANMTATVYSGKDMESISEVMYEDYGINEAVIVYECSSEETVYFAVFNPYGYYNKIKSAIGQFDISVTEATAPGDIPASAAAISADGIVRSCSINPEDDVDWFTFNAEAGNTYTIETLNHCPSTYFDDTMFTSVSLTDSDGNVLRSVDSEYRWDDVGDNRSIITYSVPVSGAYYIKINRIYNDNDQELGFYDIRISLNEGQLTQTPVINTSVEAGESVTVTGTANFGNIEFYINGKALDYLIYLDSNYEFVDVAVDGDNWEVYNLPLEPGDVFSVTVQAPDKNISLMATATAEAVPVTGISLDISALNLTAGAIETLTAAIEPANASNQNISWTSSDNSVATVNNGTVTAVSEGTATVSAITADGAYEAHCTVNVVNREQDAPVGLAGAAATRPKK